MKITGKAKTALKVLMILGNSDKRLSVREIAEKDDLPIRYLEQIVSILKKNNYVDSTKGASGGYALIGQASKISVLDVIYASEGSSNYTEEASSLLMSCINDSVLSPLDKLIEDHLSSIYLDKLIEDYKSKSNQEYMYYI